MLHTRNNTDDNKRVIFFGIALYYGDNYIICRSVSRIFRRGFIWMSDVYVMHAYACKTRGVWGHGPPGNFLETRSSEIASEAILEQKQSRSIAT